MTQQLIWASNAPNLSPGIANLDGPTLPLGEVRLTALDGSQIDISSAARPIVLNLFATWCPPCVAEIPSLLRLQRQVQDVADVYVASSETQIHLKSWLNAKPFDHETFYTIDPSLIRGGLATDSIPMTWIIMPGGIIIRSIQGAHAWDDPKVMSFLRGLVVAPTTQPRSVLKSIRPKSPPTR